MSRSSPTTGRLQINTSPVFYRSCSCVGLQNSNCGSFELISWVTGLTWHWGQAWCSSGRTRQSSGWGRLSPGMPPSLLAFSSAVSRARKQYSQAIQEQSTADEQRWNITADLAGLRYRSLIWVKKSPKSLIYPVFFQACMLLYMYFNILCNINATSDSFLANSCKMEFKGLSTLTALERRRYAPNKWYNNNNESQGSSSLYKQRAHLSSTFSYVTKMSCIPLYLYKEFHRNWAETRGRSKKIVSPFLMLLLAMRPLPWNKNNAPLVLCTLFTSLLKTEQAGLLLNPPAGS